MLECFLLSSTARSVRTFHLLDISFVAKILTQNDSRLPPVPVKQTNKSFDYRDKAAVPAGPEGFRTQFKIQKFSAKSFAENINHFYKNFKISTYFQKSILGGFANVQGFS